MPYTRSNSQAPYVSVSYVNVISGVNALKIILLFGAAFTAAYDAVFQLQGECPDNARTNLELVRGLAAFKNTGNGGEVLGSCCCRCIISLP